MKNSVQKVYEAKGSDPVLIVDRIGVIGETLAREFSKDYLVIFVSKRSISEKNEKIIHILFKNKIPQVPDNKYSKIFLIDDGEMVTKKSAFSFIDIARKNNSPIYFIGSVRNVDIEHADQLIATYSRSKVLIFGDLFDKTIVFDKNEVISKFILQARKNLKIKVSGNGLTLSFPISFEDTIKLIIKASYLDIPQKIILLFYEHPITDISLANTFKKINPNIKVDFIKAENINRKIYLPRGSQYAISKYDLEQKLKNLDLEDNENREIEVIEKNVTKERFILKSTIFIFLALLFILLLPIGMTSAYSFLGTKSLNGAEKEIENGNLKKAIKDSNQAKTFFTTAESLSKPLVVEAKMFNLSGGADGYLSKIENGKNLSSSITFLLEGASIINNIHKGESADPKEDFSKASNSLKTGLFLIQKIKAEGGLPKSFDQKLDDIAPVVDLFANSSEVLPDILGFDNEKAYLVLFQNNLELRPGGGRIGAYGILKIKDARVIDFKIGNTYALDSKLKAHIEPSFPIRRYLPSVHLFLRDSNFDPDFIKSAISAANVYTSETQEKIDGVIGVDYAFAKNLLDVMGPVKISSLNKTISGRDVYSEVFQDSLDNSPQKIQKDNFFNLLTYAMMENFKNEKNLSYMSLVQSIGKSIIEKHLNFAYQDQDVQNIFTANGWSSSIWDNRQTNSQSINDYLGISEANLGGNSVNYNISRSISKKTIILDSGKVSSRVNVAFKNNSKSSDKNATYKNYLRIIVPEGSKITSISINNKEQKTVDAVTDPSVYERIGYNPPSEIEIEGEKEMGKNVFGLFIQVLPGEVKTISVLYDLPYSVSKSQKSINYSLKVHKQPGIDSFPFDLFLSLPQGYKIVNSKNPYSTEIAKNEEIMFLISQN